MFVSRKSSGIETLEDFNGKKIGIWRSDFQELPNAFLKKFNIDAEIIPITFTVNLFLMSGVDILCVMWYNESHIGIFDALRKGQTRRKAGTQSQESIDLRTVRLPGAVFFTHDL